LRTSHRSCVRACSGETNFRSGLGLLPLPPLRWLFTSSQFGLDGRLRREDARERKSKGQLQATKQKKNENQATMGLIISLILNIFVPNLGVRCCRRASLTRCYVAGWCSFLISKTRRWCRTNIVLSHHHLSSCLNVIFYYYRTTPAPPFCPRFLKATNCAVVTR
jgi:hypothetical protein